MQGILWVQPMSHAVLHAAPVLQGYNGTVLAYGQTGAGKTLTMSGGQGIYGSSEKGKDAAGKPSL